MFLDVMLLALAATAHGFQLGARPANVCPLRKAIRGEATMDAKWRPTRKSYSPSWLRGSGDVYGEQQSEYAAYHAEQQQKAGTSSETPPPSLPPPASTAPATPGLHGGKGFGGGEATRDPAPTYIDPKDPKGKQQAIHKAESFAEYLAKRSIVPS